MKYLSLFTGIGGFELGIKQAYEANNIIQHSTKQRGVRTSIQHKGNSANHKSINRMGKPTCVGYSEIDKYAIQIYERHFNHKNYGDITKLNVQELPDFDLLVGGFPCQSFSIAGKRKGFDDTRGTLFFDVARILTHKRPRDFILENVKGLLSHDWGKTFQTILGVLTDLGYFVEWQVLNSKNFGVPQNRERVFIIGHLRGASRPKVFPIGECDKRVNGADEKTTQTNIARTVDTRTGSYPKWGQYIKQLNQPKHSNDKVYSEKGLSPTLNTAQGGNRQPFIHSIRVSGDRGKQNVYTKKDETQTLSSNPMSDNIPRITNFRRIRRLTPIECERLQGFPDNWTAEGTEGKISDTQRYKTLGNAVTVNVVKEIIKHLIN